MKIIVALLGLIFCIISVFALVNIVDLQSDYRQASDEYQTLRKVFLSAKKRNVSADVAEEQEEISPQAAELLTINSDYLGWLCIPDTQIDYPLVQSSDNRDYLNTTFKGEQNASGAVFVDARCVQGTNGELSVVYGHNMIDGSMFAALKNYRNNDFLTAHPNILLTDLTGKVHNYEIFAVHESTVDDQLFANVSSCWPGAKAYFKALGYTDKNHGLAGSNVSSNARSHAGSGVINGANSGAISDVINGASSDASSNANKDTDCFLVLTTCIGSAGGSSRILICAELVDA